MTQKNRHLRTMAQFCRAISSQLRHMSTVGKKLLSSNISSTRPYNMANFGPLTVEIGSGVWGTRANFNGFRVLASFLQRRRSPEANQTLHDVWQSPGLVYSIYIFGGSCPLTEFCQVQNSLCVQILRSSALAALLHGTGAVGVSQTLRHGRRNGIMEPSLVIIFNTYIPRVAIKYTLDIGHILVLYMYSFWLDFVKSMHNYSQNAGAKQFDNTDVISQ